jgi:putative DNA primase/helicase
MGEILKQTPNRVHNERDELMSQKRFLDDPAQATARELYLQGWSGVTGYNFDRIGRGFDNYVAAVCISMFGTTQPSPLSRYITEIRQGGRGNDGFIQRFGLAVWPDTPQWTYVDRYPDAMAREMAAKVFQKLDDMTPDTVGARQDKINGRAVGIPYLRFSTEAQVLFVDWYTNLEQRLATGEWADDLLKEHVSKYRGLMPSLALICHLADWDPVSGAAGPISVEATQRALKWIAYLETHAARIYASGDVAVVEAAYAIIGKVKSGNLKKDGFSSRDVWRPEWSRLKHRPTVAAALEMLLDYDWMTAKKVDTNGRTATVYTPNPKALT